MITATEPSTIKSKRRVHAKFLGAPNLSQAEDRIIAHVDAFVGLLGSEHVTRTDSRGEDGWGGTVNIAQVANWMTLDIISDLIFGESAGLLHDTRRRWFADAIATMSRRGILVRHCEVARLS